MSPLALLPRDISEAIEFQLRIGPVFAGTRDHVSPAWIAEPDSWIASPNSWIALKPVFTATVLEEPVIQRKLQWDDALGYIDVSRGSVRIAGVSASLWDAQGEPVEIWRIDRIRNVVLLEYRGIIDTVSLECDDQWGPSTVVGYTTQSLAVLETLIPQRLTSTDLFGPTCPSPGVPIPKPIGNVVNLPMITVVDDNAISRYVHLVGEGTDYVVSAVRRNRIGTPGIDPEPMHLTEYSVWPGTLYPGLTVVTTVLRQSTSSGALHQLYADVQGPAIERNPAVAAGLVLGDPVWGGGLPIDTGRILAEAALIPAGLVLDGVIGGDGQQRTVREWLSQILMVRGGIVDFDPELGWSVRFDSVAPTYAVMTLRTGPGVGEQTLLEVGRRVRPSLDDDVKTLRLRYGYDFVSQEYLYSAADRAVADQGAVKVITHDLLSDPDASDMVAFYVATRLAWARDRVEGAIVHEEGRQLDALSIVHVDCPQLLISPSDRRVIAAAKGVGEHELIHEYWDTSIYTHVPGGLPPGQVLTPPSTTQAPVSWYGNVNVAADSPTNPARSGIEQDDGPVNIASAVADTDLMTFALVTYGGLVQIQGHVIFGNYSGTTTGVPTGIVLKIRVDGSIPSSAALPRFSVPDATAAAGYEQSLIAYVETVLPAGSHQIKLQALTNKVTWQAYSMAINWLELAR